MATSLAAQLQRLAVPQSTIYKDDKKTVSLLFDPKEAAHKDRDTFYEIGCSGLNELIALNEAFIVYECTLFSPSSKEFERAMENKEVNENLDSTIERFLLQLSPYILLQPAHKALEWLINRYHIHQYNQDAIMALILPYHSTNIFVRIIQLMDIKQDSNKWLWLYPVKKAGTPLANQSMFNQCKNNNATLAFISNMTLKYVKQYGEKASQLNTVFAFFCQTAIGAINSSKKIKESIINALLPTSITAIDSPIADFRSSAYIILGYLFTKATFKTQTLDVIVDKLLTTSFDICYDVTLLIIILYEHQTSYVNMSESILNDMSIDVINTLCGHLKVLIERKNNIMKFVLAFLSSVLSQMQKDSEEFMRFSKLPEILIEEVDLKNQQPEKVIRCVLDVYLPNKIKDYNKNKSTDKDGNESDLEIIEDDDHFSFKIFNWYAVFLKTFERQYPDAFDAVIKNIMSSESQLKRGRKDQLSKLLGFKPSIAHKLGGTYLFENLNHVNADLRIEGIKYIQKDIEAIMKEDVDFVKDSIVSRLGDTHPQVVDATLDIPISKLEELLSEIELTNALVTICGKANHAWKPVIKKAIKKFCSLSVLPVNQEVVIALLPYLFAYDEESTEVAWNILSSEWGKKFKLTPQAIGLKKSHKDNPRMINQMVYKGIFEKKMFDFDDILDENLLNKNNTTDICFYMLLKSCSFDKAAVEEIALILNLLLESVESRSIVMATEGQVFSSEIVPEFIKQSRRDNILFEVIEYLFSRVIEDVNIKEIQKPWCNVCKTSEMILIRRLYEICITGCGIPNYGEHYVKLLHNLLHKFFKTPKEKFEFIANFACGHILYAADPKDVIGPELQLKSIKLLTNFLAVNTDRTWLYESDVLVLMILLDLNNPLTAIRQSAIDIVIQILQEKPDSKKYVYIRLFELIMVHEQALLLDHQQIGQVLITILTQKDPLTKVFRRNCLLKLMGILNSGITPTHIKSSFLKILANFDIAIAFPHIIPVLNSLQTAVKSYDTESRLTLDIYESNIFKSVYRLINEATATTFDQPEVWSSIEFGLKEYRECILQEDQSFTSPAVLIMKQIEEDNFKKIPDTRRKDFVRLIGLAGAISNSPTISSVAARVMKKIHLTFNDFKPIFQKMIIAVDPAADQPKTKRNISTSSLSYELTETDDWRLGVAMLEFVQNKKKMDLDKSFVPILFELLDKCLRFEEQSCVEYTKQLILSSLWYYCKKFINEKDKDVVKALKSGFKVELIVQCIRGTQNPQTHHHALILLSHAAYMLPEQVLHHTMEIFTFMGSSVLRHDDAYSFQIITRIIETLIPILVKMDKVTDLSQNEIMQLQKRAVPVLRIFADVVLHVPEHRRLPLYKKLIETIGPNDFLWVFVALLLEAHVTHFSDGKKKQDNPPRSLAEQEVPINRLDFGQNILLEFPTEVWLENFNKLMLHIKSLPQQKDENAMDTDVDPSDIFSVNGHSPNQLRHYKYIVITFMNSCLSSSIFIQHSSQATDLQIMGMKYKTLIINILTYIQSISKISDEKTAKYWRVMLHHTYDLLDHTNNLLSAPMFLSVIRGLLKHTLHTVRRKSMELLNSKIQHQPEFLANADREALFSLLDPLLDIIRTIESENVSLNEIATQELELNQQTALLSLKLLTRMLATENPEPFKPVLDTVTEYTCNPSISGNVMASIVLCLAELCSNLKAHALGSLRKFMPALIKVLKKQRKAETPELVLLSTVTAISKIVESLPLFLSPYVQKILYEYSILLAKWNANSNQAQVSVVVAKLGSIKKKIAGAIPPRVLIPAVSETHQMLLEKGNFDSIGPVMSVLADSFVNVTTADFTALQQDLTAFFLTALQLRSDAADKDLDMEIIDKAEDEVVKALVNLVLKLSETSFRPFYFKIYDWAIRTNVDGQKDRVITFYRLSSAIAEQLKGLFVLFASHFIKNAAELLDACNNGKTEEYYFDSEDKCLTLIKYIIKTLNIVFLYDSQSFLNKDRFETLMQPVVDQLENTMGGIPSLKARAAEYIIPCVTQFAVATADDSLWKLLNYQILLKTRHNDAEIRLTALECLVVMAGQLGSSWLPLLAESVPFLAELLEDGDSRIEAAAKDAVRTLEGILGEPLQKYF